MDIWLQNCLYTSPVKWVPRSEDTMGGISLCQRNNWYRPRAASIARSLVHGMAVKCRLKPSRMVRM